MVLFGLIVFVLVFGFVLMVIVFGISFVWSGLWKEYVEVFLVGFLVEGF